MGDEGAGLGYYVVVGKTTGMDFRTRTRDVLNRYQYIVERYDDRSGVLVMQTDWKFRSPFPEESENGIREGRTRLIIEAYAQMAGGTRLGGSDSYRVKLRAENMVMRNENTTWGIAPLCEEHLLQVKKLTSDLKFEYMSRARRF